MTEYVVVVEDNMINYPMGKDFPGKVHTVGNGFIFMDTHAPTGFNPSLPITVRPGTIPQFIYYDANGQQQEVDLNEGDPQFYLPITPNFNGGWAWLNECSSLDGPDCTTTYVRFGPGWNNDGWSN